jgi:hypothetical protein
VADKPSEQAGLGYLLPNDSLLLHVSKESVQLLFGHQPASMFLSCSSDVRQQSGGLQLAAKASGS